MKKGRVVIFSAPSGSGKSTLVHFLMKQDSSFGFSVSATSRPPRGEEKHGVDYYFFTPDEFRARIAADEFVEYEEVYPGRFYGTLKSQVEHQLEQQNILFDVDVKGGCSLKKYYGERALFIFVQAPSVEILRERLIGRGDTSMDEIEKRVSKAEYEMTFAKFADRVIVNDDLEKAKRDLMDVVEKFLNE
ncbi:MAG: guanylate kinase [Bacteroidaceae bacterium]|jgi:guanylate kinase|nr:guanylate kinase [Bacteroidaceae bacterium]MBR4967420.1 guanylate kinase [Bacteroidaceae bacterium]